MAVALDREAIRLNIGGDFAGDFADGVIKPNIGPDYAATGFWDDLLRAADPGHRRPRVRQEADRGLRRGRCRRSRSTSPTPRLGSKTAAIVIDSLAQGWHHGHAGADRARQVLQRRLRPDEGRRLRLPVAGALTGRTLRPSSPPLFTQKGGWDLSQLDDAAFNAEVDAAHRRARPGQAGARCGRPSTRRPSRTSASSRRSSGSARRHRRNQAIAAASTAGRPYGSWPYGEMYVIP